MYFEEAKKKVMALLRHKGSPTLFLTLSCAEYSWKGLLKQIMECELNRMVSEQEIEDLSTREKNRMVSENVDISTQHFQKRIEKEFKMLTSKTFFGDNCPYHVRNYYYRVEFQQRGAPHVHCLLWLEDDKNNPAPTFWISDSDDSNLANKMEKIEKNAEMIISGSEDEAMCEKHYSQYQLELIERRKCINCFSERKNFEECSLHKKLQEEAAICSQCNDVKEIVRSFQHHQHSFTCSRKEIIINAKEGHGRGDGEKEGDVINSYKCRFNFPQFPMNKTTLVLGMPKDLSKEEVSKRKSDLKKIKKFMIRQTNSGEECSKRFKNLTFFEFLVEAGMVEGNQDLKNVSKKEKLKAYQRYINAISASVRGTGTVFLKRTCKDIFTNNFNCKIINIHQANIDIQIVVDQVYSVKYNKIIQSKILYF